MVRDLRLQPPPAPTTSAAPPDRGQLMETEDVRARWFPRRTARWVRENVGGKFMINGRTPAWWERDVEAWLEQQTRANRKVV